VWIDIFLPADTEGRSTRPTRPTSENDVGRLESLVAVAPSDTSDTSDKKKVSFIFHEGEGTAQEPAQGTISQLSYKNTESVRHFPDPAGEIAYVASAPMGKPRRCLLCGHWTALPRRCWWVGVCAVDGHAIGYRSVCILGRRTQ
jgi:hypothetical protein